MSARRVVVLARAGSARERTEQAVKTAGAELAAVFDPVETTEADVRAVGADALLVVLDAATEAVLDRFDPLLADPGWDVIFDEADVAVRRDGWEAARWVRHLAAKLHGHEDVLPPPTAARSQAPDFEQEMQVLALRVAALPELPQARKTEQRAGAVVVIAGMGGPDAARQLLAGLPGDFPRPVVLYQALEVGHHEKLVRQMGRATALQPHLAEPGMLLQAGHLYVMPEGLDLVQEAQGLTFAAATGAPRFAGLPASDSAFLLLSGAAPAMVDVALGLHVKGALVYGQAPESCFDPAASHQLVARGGQTRSLAELSRELLQRWSA
jgi:chemotaxis response regulator CheB